MQKRPLGRSGISITPLMLGGNVFGWTADRKASFEVLDAFVDLGGDAIDTADTYSSWVPGNQGGESESLIGAWLKQSGKRDKVVIATKVGFWPKRKGIRAKNIFEACDDSLKRLQIERIDLYQLHGDDGETPPDEFMAALDQLVKAGKVRAVGASNFGAARLSEALRVAKDKGWPHLATLQPEYNLLEREIERELVPLCQREAMAIIPYYALASGYLTGKYRSEADKTKNRRGGHYIGVFDEMMAGKGPAVLAAMDGVAVRTGASLAQIALAWLTAKPGVAAPIASATNAVQVGEIMGALEIRLSAEDMAALDRAGA